MPKIKNPFAAAAAFAERLSNPDTPLPLPRRSAGNTQTEAEPEAVPEEAAPMEAVPAAPEIAVSAASEPSAPAKSALHQPRILKEYVIPMADDTPEAVTFSSFSESESEGDAAEAPAPASAPAEFELPENVETAVENPLHRKPRPVKAPISEELSSNLWALSILLGVACTVVAFFVGALA